MDPNLLPTLLAPPHCLQPSQQYTTQQKTEHLSIFVVGIYLACSVSLAKVPMPFSCTL